MFNRFNLPEDEESRQRLIKRREEQRAETRWLASGLAGTCIVFIAAILALQNQDKVLRLGVIAFAVALPLLIGALMLDKYLPHYKASYHLLNFGAGGVVLGIGMILWHITLLACVGYGLAILVAFGAICTKRYEQISSEFRFGFLSDYYSDEPRLLAPKEQAMGSPKGSNPSTTTDHSATARKPPNGATDLR